MGIARVIWNATIRLSRFKKTIYMLMASFRNRLGDSYPHSAKRLTKIEERVHALVCAQAPLHPRELESHLGHKRAVNAWGSYSKATTLSLDTLRYYGHLRVAGRDKGIRLYQAARPQPEFLAPQERLRALILL